MLKSLSIVRGEFEIKQNNDPSKPLEPSIQADVAPSKPIQNILSTKPLIHCTQTTTKPSILLIEDDPIIQFVHKKMLAELHCLVHLAVNGREAFKIIEQELPHLIFVDISLPDIHGFDIIKTIRAHTYLQDIPIIVLTVYTSKEEKAACLQAGANEFASKPISKMQLKKLLQRYVSIT